MSHPNSGNRAFVVERARATLRDSAGALFKTSPYAEIFQAFGKAVLHFSGTPASEPSDHETALITLVKQTSDAHQLTASERIAIVAEILSGEANQAVVLERAAAQSGEPRP